MKTSLFTNFTDEPIEIFWDGKWKTYKAGEAVHMPSFLAEHSAKHLVNRELLRKDDNGSLIHENGDKFVSPKKPEEIPLYMELFNKAYFSEEESNEEKSALDVDIEVANKNKEMNSEVSSTIEVEVPPNTEEDTDTEDAFEGKPQEVEVETK